MKSTKVFVIKLKQIIYGIIIALVSIILILFISLMIPEKSNNSVSPTMSYVPGVYTSSVYLDDQALKVEVIVDSNHINSIKLCDIDTSTKTLYPYLVPAMNTLESQIISSQSINELTIESSNKYTSSLLLEAIEAALEKADVN